MISDWLTATTTTVTATNFVTGDRRVCTGRIRGRVQGCGMTAAGDPPGAPARRSSSRSMVLNGIRPYDKQWLRNDVLAGVTLAALAIPEVMGYTKIAGMPVITGLYTIVVPGIEYTFHAARMTSPRGGCRLPRPTRWYPRASAALGVPGLQPGTKQWVALAGVKSALLAGVHSCCWLDVTRLGFLANFLSRTVLVGFLTGVGIQVAIGSVRQACSASRRRDGTLDSNLQRQQDPEVHRHDEGEVLGRVQITTWLAVAVERARGPHRLPSKWIQARYRVVWSRWSARSGLSWGIRLGRAPRRGDPRPGAQEACRASACPAGRDVGPRSPG